MEHIVEHWDNGNKKSEEYYVNGDRHRDDGPSYSEWYENGEKNIEGYWVNNRLHREDGPAITRWHRDGQMQSKEYYINGNKIKSEWFTQLGKDINKDFSNEMVRDLILNIHGGL